MSTGTELDVAVVGAGVVGLAVASALARRGRAVVVFEAEPRPGTHTSARNSEVIHAGILYPKGSLKAELCVAGKALLYEYAASAGVAHARLGKLIVATRDAEIPALEQIARQAHDNGVTDLAWLDPVDVRALEPAVHAVRALHSPSTGIVDSHGLMSALQRDLRARQGELVLATPVLGGRAGARHIELDVGGREPLTVGCRAVVNAAGLWAPSVSRSIVGVAPASVPREYFARGQYFVLGGPSPFRRLVYPVPAAGGLGIHVTLDLAGQARFGPDVSWVESIDYAFDERRADDFYAAIRTYYPALSDGVLAPGYTGIRPKLGPPGSANDFVIQAEDTHGVPGLVALYGIESPGLTASLALAARVVDLLGDF